MKTGDVAAVMMTVGSGIILWAYSIQGEKMPTVMAIALAVVLAALIVYYSAIMLIELARLARKALTQ